MTKQNVFTSVFILSALMTACSTKPVLMTTSDVKVSREDAGKKCKDLGPIRGDTITTQGTAEEALEDLKKTAAALGANYVKILSMGENTHSVTGIAYDCP